MNLNQNVFRTAKLTNGKYEHVLYRDVEIEDGIYQLSTSIETDEPWNKETEEVLKHKLAVEQENLTIQLASGTA